MSKMRFEYKTPKNQRENGIKKSKENYNLDGKAVKKLK
jgi:hypothetical protein